MPKPIFPKTADLMQRLRTKHAGNSYAILTEVGDATGYGQTRWADALTMSLWPSRGLEIHGFELKVSRTDWQKELKNPAKAEAICRYCDRWWVVVADESIIKPGELPKTWGLMAPYKDTLKVVVQAPELQPIPLDRNFVAAILRRAAEQSADVVALREARNQGVQEGRAEVERGNNSALKYMTERFETLRDKVDQFEKASGVEFSRGWNRPEKIGDAVRMVLAGEHKANLNEILRIRAACEKILETTKPLTEKETP